MLLAYLSTMPAFSN